MSYTKLNRSIGLLVLASFASCFLCGVSKANMNCTHTDNLRLSKIMTIGDTPEAVVSKLVASKTQYYRIYSKGQEISLADLRARKYKSLSPIYISVRSSNAPEDKHPNLSFVREDELLKFVFDEHGRLANMSCKKIYTAP